MTVSCTAPYYITWNYIHININSNGNINIGLNHIMTYDIHINKYCTHAIVSPNMESITTAVNQIMESCESGEDEWRKLITLPIFGDVRIYNHGWINDFLRNVGVE